MEQVDHYAGWKAELAGKPRGLPAGVASAGFWAVRTKDGRQPVATWVDPDIGMIAQVGTAEEREADAAFCEQVFSRAKAITEPVYRRVVAGEPWPDEVRVPEPKRAAAPPDVITANPDASHADQRNSTEDLVIADQFAELQRDEAAWLASIGGKITAQEHADKQVGFRDAYLALQSSAEKARTAEKKPHLDAGRTVDAKWKPLVDKATWAKIEAEARPQAFLKAERDRRIAEAAAKAAENQAVRSSDIEVKAGTGRGIRVKEPKQIVIVEDEAKLRAHMATLEEAFWRNKFVRDTVEAIALAQLRSGINVPGARLGTEETA